MKRIFIPAAVCCSLLLLVSCQKEVSFKIDETSEEEKKDSIYISRYVELDPNFTSGLDTAAIYNFAYDSRKRLTTMSLTYFVVGTHNVDDVYTERSFYNGIDTLPHLLTVTGTTGLLDSLFISYDSKGVAIRDSLREYGPSLFIYTSYVERNEPGRLKLKETFQGDSLIVTQVFNNGNVASELYLSYFGGLPNTANSTLWQATYDNKPNPFRRVSIPHYVFEPFANPSHMIEHWKNNLTSYTIAGPLGGGGDINTYTYRSDGYPLSRVQSGLTNPPFAKGYYFYTAL